MRFQQHPPTFLFFTGKGGVGKTSLSCATAMKLADRARSVLLVSTDPASKSDRCWPDEATSQHHRHPCVPGLDAMNINPANRAPQYRERVVGPMRGQLRHPRRRCRASRSSSPDPAPVEIAAFDEFTALIGDPE